MDEKQKQFITIIVVASFIVSSAAGFIAGGIGAKLFPQSIGDLSSGQQIISSDEEAVIKVVKDVSPAVVSIIATKDLPVIEQYYAPLDNFSNNPFSNFFQQLVPQYRQNGTQEQEVGGGSGFVISSDGMILTNRHVVDIDGADYTVLTNDGQKYAARVLAKDPIQDIAILKIEKNNLPVVRLGDSDNLQIGQSVIAIGNALGEFRNTVSVGVISGLQRSVTTQGGAGTAAEQLEGVIQTDAAINPGNSGGPLLNLSGEVIGINVAIVQNAQNIAFTLPINPAKRDIEQVKKQGKISYPFLGIRYTLITPALGEQRNLTVDYGALIVGGQTQDEPAVVSGSPADKAGLRENDIILEIDGKKIGADNPVNSIIQNHNVGDTITLKILSGGQEKAAKVVLGER
ncbi:MAG: trypsin-like peptidase domain-containing protein [Candidatus Portnoybacteria bacterium]|nr:trypsin-like peptidase domain-containing protein [Candidatus Portnoybacteria bacterium]